MDRDPTAEVARESCSGAAASPTHRRQQGDRQFARSGQPPTDALRKDPNPYVRPPTSVGDAADLGDFLRDLARVLFFWGLKSDRPDWRQANRQHGFLMAESGP